MRTEHLGEVDEDLGVRGDVVAACHRGGGLAGEGDGLVCLAAAREHARAGGLPLGRISEDVPCLLELGECVLVPTLDDEDVGDPRAVEGDVVRRAHLRRTVDRVA